MLERILEKYALFSEGHPYIILIVAAVITLIMAGGLMTLKTETDVTSSLPDNLEVIQIERILSDKFSTGQFDSITSIVYTLDDSTLGGGALDVRSPEVLNSMDELAKKLKSKNEVTGVVSVTDTIKQLNGGKLPSTLSESKKLFAMLPPEATGRIISSDYSTAIMILQTETTMLDEAESALFVASMKDTISSVFPPQGFRIVLAGMLAMRSELLAMMGNTMGNTSMYAMIGVALLLYLYFRKITRIFLPIISLILGLVWTFGTMAYLGYAITTSTMAMGAMLLGLGIDYGIHLMHRYDEDGIIKAISGTGSAIIITTATTMAGFLALVFADMAMISEMGMAMALGVFFCMVATILVLPPLMIIEEKISKKIKVKI